MSSAGNPTKILVVTQHYFSSDKNNYHLDEMINNLIKDGNEITVLTSKGVNDTLSSDSKAQIITINQEPFCGNSDWSYVFHGISFMWNAIKTGSAIPNSFDKVIGISPTGFSCIAAKILAGKKRAAYILEEKEPWPESAVTKGYITKDSPIHKAAIMVNNWIQH